MNKRTAKAKASSRLETRGESKELTISVGGGGGSSMR